MSANFLCHFLQFFMYRMFVLLHECIFYIFRHKAVHAQVLVVGHAFNFLGGDVVLTGLRPDSLQGDRCYRGAMGRLREGPAEISLRDCPDLGPVLFALAAACRGGVFTGTRRLRLKESDRVSAMKQELAALGAELYAGEDRVEIPPAELHPPARPLDGHNDHRIVMALSLLLTLTGGEIAGAEAVRKSYPGFFADLGRLGLRAEVVE